MMALTTMVAIRYLGPVLASAWELAIPLAFRVDKPARPGTVAGAALPPPPLLGAVPDALLLVVSFLFCAKKFAVFCEAPAPLLSARHALPAHRGRVSAGLARVVQKAPLLERRRHARLLRPEGGRQAREAHAGVAKAHLERDHDARQELLAAPEDQPVLLALSEGRPGVEGLGPLREGGAAQVPGVVPARRGARSEAVAVVTALPVVGVAVPAGQA